MNPQENQTFPINMKEGSPQPCITYYEVEEPLCIQILKSGWSKPQLYHVLVEFGDRMETTYHTLESNQIQDMFGIDVEESFTDVVTILKRTDILQSPNDSDLGRLIRANIVVK